MITQKKIRRALLLGSSFSAVPLLNELKLLGIHVTVCGLYKDDPCHTIGESSLFVDYSNYSEIESHLQTNRYDFIVPSCNDTAYKTGCRMAEKFSYPGFDNLETMEILHCKRSLRKYLNEHNYPTPATYTLQEAAMVISEKHQLIIKPVDSFSGKGVAVVKEEQELNSKATTAKEFSESRQIVIEDYFFGQLVSHSAFISDGKIVSEFFVDEFCTVYPYQVNSSCHPSSLPARYKKEIHVSMARLAAELRLNDGLLHTQLIYNDDKWVIIECMRRAPGDLYGHLIQSSVEYRYWEQYVRPFLGLRILDKETSDLSRYIARHTVSSPSHVNPHSFTVQSPLSRLEVYQLHLSATDLKPAPFDKMAIIFCEYSTSELLWDETKNMHTNVTLNAFFNN